jgi:drug/metabolite transporter (DMT)-like permease
VLPVATSTSAGSRPAPATRGFGPAETVLLLALSSMWGLSFLFIELALRGLGPVWIVAGRTVVGGATLLAVLAVAGRSLPRDRRTWGHLLVLGAVNNAVPWAGVAWAQQSLPSGLTALLMALVPTSTLLVSAAVGLERITRVRVVGLLLALGGVALIVAGDVDEPGRAVAVLVVVAATVMYASAAVYAKRTVSGTMPPLALATGQVCCAALAAVPAALLLEGPPDVAALGMTVIGATLALGVFGTGLAFLVFYVLIERVGATNATLTTYLIPVVAVVAGALVLDERLAPAALAGGGLIGVGIWLAQRRARPSTPEVVEETHR